MRQRQDVVYAPPHECVAQAWTEAIAILNVAAAEHRLEAAKVGRANSPGYPYSEEMKAWEDLMAQAARLDELAHWLRDNPTLPKSDEPASFGIWRARP